MTSIESTVVVVITAFILDFIIGDPQNPFHPIRLIGFVISSFVKLYKRLHIQNSSVQFLYGMIMNIITIALFFGSTFLLVRGLYGINWYLGIIIESILCYFMLSARALYKEGEKLTKEIKKKDIEGARKKLSYIVGRDTKNLSFEQITKATIETIAENFSDGVVAPLLCMFIGGAPLAIAYKTVNTFDSMVGYKNETYEYLGKFSAKLDDVVNYIPARLSAGCMIVAAAIKKQSAKEAYRIYKRDRYNHTSPNSAHTEAACAGALGIQLGGTSTYKGKVVEKPTMGDDKNAPRVEYIMEAAKLMYTSAVVALILFAGASVLINIFI